MINEKRIREALRLEPTDSIFLLVNSKVSGTRYGFIYSVSGEEVKQKGVLIRNGEQIELSPEAKNWVTQNLGKDINHIGKEELTIKTPSIHHVKF